MGKRSSNDNGGQQNGGGPAKRAKLNGHYNGDISNGTLSSPENQESPKPEFQLSRDIVNGTILTDIAQNKWRIGKPIGKGSFGEIFLASNDISTPVTSENAKYVVKIEPHSNGPLFVEIHCLLNTAKNTEDNPLPPGMPQYIGSGSHYFKNSRYRFLVLPRFDRDLHSLIKHRRVDSKSVLILAVQILEVLEHLHDKGYCHSDIKAENLMISKCTFQKSEIIMDSSSCSEDESSSVNEDEEEEDDDEESDEEATYKTPVNRRTKKIVQYSGSNPVRSCRIQKRNSTYQEMLTTHYLRPSKKINYSEFFGDDNSTESDNTIDYYITRHRLSRSEIKARIENKMETPTDWVTEDRIFLIDFGLASKFLDSTGTHRPFCMDQRRAHDGTLEFTSRDAHMGAHSRRSDLECLGYNLIFWSQGYLPWKENAAQNQPERVHWMKEYLMADVREMLKHIYGKTVPKYLGEFMQYVGKLAYHERPDYKKCKRIFIREFIKLGYKKERMILDVKELIKNSVDVKEEIENNNLFEMKNIKSIMKNLGMIMPFRESNSNRVSPKNLRSKSEKEAKKKRKKFSWAEILSQDPDQIARERAEKEFDRDPTTETPLIRYVGKPTYAILEIENRLKFKDRLEVENGPDEETPIKGYTKPMMDLLKKRQAALITAEEIKKSSSTHHKQTTTNTNSTQKVSRLRAKAGLRTVIIPTKRGLDYNHELVQRRAKRSHKNSGDFTTDESSCSSLNSVVSSNAESKKSQYSNVANPTLQASPSHSSCSSGLSDEDSRDALVVFSPKRTRYGINKLNGANTVSTKNKRKRSIPRKKNAKEMNLIPKVKRKSSFYGEDDSDGNADGGDTSGSEFVVPEFSENEDDWVTPFKKRLKRTRSG